VYVNNTAEGIIQVVDAFATLLSQSMTVGENATTYFYDNFRVSSALTPWVSAQNVSIISPQTESERLADKAVPSVQFTPAAANSQTSSLAISVIAVPPRSFGADASAFKSSPLYVKVASDAGERPAQYLGSIRLTFPFTEADHSMVNYQPRNFTSVCTNRYDVFTYTCPDSGHVVTHNCSRGHGEYNTICPVPKPACAKLNLHSGDATVVSSCSVVDYGATYVTCACDVAPAEERRLTRRLVTDE
jgi:hypothetical protein